MSQHVATATALPDFMVSTDGLLSRSRNGQNTDPGSKSRIIRIEHQIRRFGPAGVADIQY